MRLVLVVAATLLTVIFTAPADAELNKVEPCLAESVFDDRCDENGGGDDRCFENCKICETRNDRFGCYSTHGAGSCSCSTDFDDEGNLFCTERGTCSVEV